MIKYVIKKFISPSLSFPNQIKYIIKISFLLFISPFLPLLFVEPNRALRNCTQVFYHLFLYK